MKENFEKPLISAVIVVKDNIEFLPDCLKSLIGVVDEMIFVTNRDNVEETRANFLQISEMSLFPKHPLFVFDIGNNNSELKNSGIRQATGKFILVMEPEDRFILLPRMVNNDIEGPNKELTREETIDIFRSDINSLTEDVAGIIFAMQTKVNDGNERYSLGFDYNLRLFRNDGYKFTGYVLERIEESIHANKKMSVPYPMVVIENVGFMNYERNIERKAEILQVLDLEIEETNNWRAYLNRSKLKITNGNQFGAINDYLGAQMTCPSDITSRAILYNTGIQIYLFCHDMIKAQECAKKSLALSSGQVFPLFQLGIIELSFNRKYYAKSYFESALKNLQYMQQNGLIDVEFPVLPQMIIQYLDLAMGKTPVPSSNLNVN